MSNTGIQIKYFLIGFLFLSPHCIFCQTKIFSSDSINFKEWNYNQRKIVRTYYTPWEQEIEIIAESNEGIFYSNHIHSLYSKNQINNLAVKILDGKNATLVKDDNSYWVDDYSNTYIVYEDNGIIYASKRTFNKWSTSILISDSTELGSSPIADCDKEGNLHILYGFTDSSNNGNTYVSSLKYVKVADNQGELSSVIYDIKEEDNQDTLLNYTIATDLLFQDETVFLAYQLSNDSIYVKYSIDSGESWTLSLVFQGINPSLSVGFGYVGGSSAFPIPKVDDGTSYPVILYLDLDNNLLHRYAQFITKDKSFNWWLVKKLQDGPIDFACIDDIINPHPFGYSYIFQKNDVLYHAFTNFRESIIMDTLTNNAIVSSIAYKQFDSTKVDIIWYEKNDDTYEMYYQWFKKIGLKTYFDPTDVESNHVELLKIYPNPFINTAILSLPNPDGYPYMLYLKDLSGKTVRIIENITEGKYEIARDGLPSGLYLLELRGPNIYRRKIIIQ